MNKTLEYYMKQPYVMCIVPDEEGIYTLYFPDLPGCVTTGLTPEEALKNGEDAKKCWFEACIEQNIKIPEPSKKDKIYA